MRIAVLSDTHDSLPPGLLSHIGGADEIWHLGDVTSLDLLSELEALGHPLKVVLGNCDTDQRWPLVLTFERSGLRFHLIHIPPALAPPGANVVLHGHTHMPRDWTDPLGVRWLNPGSASRPRGGYPASFGWLELDASGIQRWDIQTLKH